MGLIPVKMLIHSYRAFRRFGQAKFPDGGLILGLIFSTDPAASKNDACFKRGQNRLDNKQLGLLILIRDTLCSNGVSTAGCDREPYVASFYSKGLI